MKKTLAILLALLMVGSIVLVSCDGGRTPIGDGFDDEDNDYIGDDESDESGSESDSTTESDSQNANNNNNNNDNNTNYGWTATNDTVYAGVDLNLRDNPNGSKLATIPFGTSLARSETNGEWDKVTYNGQTGYVKHLYVATSGASFTFTASEGTPSISINPENTNNVIFYQSPFYIGDSNKESENWLCASGLKPAHFVEGYTLKKLGVSNNGDWVKVEFKGKIEVNSNNKVDYSANAGVFYIAARCFKDGRIIDSTWSNENGTGGLG